MREQNSHYQTHQRRCDEFQHKNQNHSASFKNRQNRCTQFVPPNSFTREPLKSAYTTNISITNGIKNTALEAPEKTTKS